MIDIHNISKPKDGPAPRWFHVAVAVSMVLSAVAALIGSIHTSRSMTALVEQNARLVRASSTPVLEFGNRNIGDDNSSTITLSVRNVGSGLARIHWLELLVDDKPVPNIESLIRSAANGDPGHPKYLTGSVAPRLLGAQVEQPFVIWNQPRVGESKELEAWHALDRARASRITFRTCYCSIFDECWLSTLKGSVPAPIADCSRPGSASFKS